MLSAHTKTIAKEIESQLDAVQSNRVTARRLDDAAYYAKVWVDARKKCRKLGIPLDRLAVVCHGGHPPNSYRYRAEATTVDITTQGISAERGHAYPLSHGCGEVVKATIRLAKSEDLALYSLCRCKFGPSHQGVFTL